MYHMDLFNDDRLVTRWEDGNRSFLKPPYIPTNREPGKKTKDGYLKQLRKGERIFSNAKLENDKCMFITLTTRDECSEKEINSHFRSFYRSVKRASDDVEYLKALDSHQKGSRFHLHIIFQFKNGIPLINGKKMDKKWVSKHWKYSSLKAINVQYTYNAWGCLDYIVSPKLKNALSSEDGYVKFSKYTRLITTSRNFRFEEPVKCFEVETLDEVKAIIEKYKEVFREKYGYEPFMRTHKAKWIKNGKQYSKDYYWHLHP